VIGSVKSNIGHLLTAAGSAALMKTLLAMKERTLPPTANFAQPAKGVELEKSEVRLPEGPIRELGEFEINIHLHPEVDAVLKLAVVEEA
jgi:3-oxoacyl-(acyl-carrier-protein) synthase